jgi:hypothetical protein
MPGPGEYVPNVTEGITRVEDLPHPHVERRTRNYRQRRCPRCGRAAPRCRVAQRTLQDLGSPRSGRPIDLAVTYSKHRCRRCFNADLSEVRGRRSVASGLGNPILTSDLRLLTSDL